MLLMRKKAKVCPYFFPISHFIISASIQNMYMYAVYISISPSFRSYSHMYVVYTFVLWWFQFEMRNGYKIGKTEKKKFFLLFILLLLFLVVIFLLYIYSFLFNMWKWNREQVIRETSLKAHFNFHACLSPIFLDFFAKP